MELQIRIVPYVLHFLIEAGTSRGILKEHQVYYIVLSDKKNPDVVGIGEVAPLPHLSIDALGVASYLESMSLKTWNNTSDLLQAIPNTFPSLVFGMETALQDLENGGKRCIFKNGFFLRQQKIWINGLVWMNEPKHMLEQVKDKVLKGFRTIKLKVGALDFVQEYEVLQTIRDIYGYDLEIRLDANGAWDKKQALDNINKLVQFQIHSIEQPLAVNQWKDLREVCQESPIAIGLDEELIGRTQFTERIALLDTIKPQYLILKPTLLGGFASCRDWIAKAEERNIPWWLTSALESNIGLNAIAQFAAEFPLSMPQGLGTGGLYSNNIRAPLSLEGEYMGYDFGRNWESTNLW